MSEPAMHGDYVERISILELERQALNKRIEAIYEEAERAGEDRLDIMACVFSAEPGD